MQYNLVEPLQFWGKSQSNDDSGLPFHPLIFHCLDVAACFERLVLSRPPTVDLLEGAFGACLKHILPGLTALVALHDIGKALTRFQMKVPELCPAGIRTTSAAGLSYNHAEGGFTLLKVGLEKTISPILANLNQEAQRPVLQAVAHHHGRPLGETPMTISPQDVEQAQNVAGAILTAFEGESLSLPPIDERASHRLSWPLSGLITLADWLGSSEHFAFVAPEEHTPMGYWQQIARPRAAQALAAAGLGRTAARPDTGGEVLFGSNFALRPAQRLAATLEIGSHAQLFILEELTGAGKTEAALILAHRLMAAGRASGLLIALPTTATADAMYGRMAHTYARLFADGSLPSLALAHGRRHLNDGFRASLFTEDVKLDRTIDDGGNRAACNAFFADDRRKTFLADVGVGTVDQALMAVLPTKFATLRQYGLADKVLIIDEAHAYDAYMSREVERLLTFHAAAGGSAILLSATLPQKVREAFGNAFRGGGKRRHLTLTEQAYPLLTHVPAAIHAPVSEHAIEPTARQPIEVRRLGASDEALDLIVEAACNGASVAYIRNTVDDARETADALKVRGLSPVLFHARFAMTDRLAIEQHVLDTFGKAADAGQRAGQVLVATQVAEQSLDLDVDLMVSDLAPVDLLIQRAGRLWRHQRGERPTKAPVLHVVSPAPDENAGEDWLLPMLRGTSFVYSAHGLLWLTAKTLFETGRIDAPGDLRRLIETVYGPDLAGADAHLLPEGLRAAEIAAAGSRHSERSIANQNLLSIKDGYCATNRAWLSDTVTPTRLGEPQFLIRLARWQNGRLLPWAAQRPGRDTDSTHLWALSEVSLRASQASGRPDLSSPLREAVSAVETRWQRLAGDGTKILPLEPTGDHWTGALTRERNKRTEIVPIRYAAETGLVLG